MGAALLPTVLDSLVRQDYQGEYEILVIDDGSHDATPEVLEEWSLRFPGRLRVFRQRNSGPASARNKGAREAKGDFLIFVDDDCIAEPTWLRSLQSVFEETGAAAVAGAVVNPDDGWVGRYVNRESIIAHVLSRDGLVQELITGNAGVRAEVFKKLGGFDEAIRVAGGEDTEFSLRLRAEGHRIVPAPEARVHHQSRMDLVAYLKMIFRHGRGRRRLGERFPAYHLKFPYLRLLWLLWPIRSWILRDYLRYRTQAVSRIETIRYLSLRYLENITRVAGYLRGS